MNVFTLIFAFCIFIMVRKIEDLDREIKIIKKKLLISENLNKKYIRGDEKREKEEEKEKNNKSIPDSWHRFIGQGVKFRKDKTWKNKENEKE